MKKRWLAGFMTHQNKKLPVTMKMLMQSNVVPRTKPLYNNHAELSAVMRMRFTVATKAIAHQLHVHWNWARRPRLAGCPPGKTGHCEPGSVRRCGLEYVTARLYSRHRADTDVKWIKPKCRYGLNKEHDRLTVRLTVHDFYNRKHKL